MIDRYLDWKAWDGVDFGRFSQEDAIYFTHELRNSGFDSLVGLRIGELGFGNGCFGGWVHKAGGKWVGREAISELQQRAKNAGFDVVSADETFSDVYGAASFDLIVALDVIEHLKIENIRIFLAECKEALKPGGVLIFRVPSGDSPFSGAIYYGDLTHRTLLGSSAVRQIAVESGLNVVKICSPVLPVRGMGLFRGSRRLAVWLVQIIVFPVIRSFLMGNGSAVISPNMIVVLQK